MKRLARSVIERAIAGLGPHRWAGLRGPRLLILTYHRVLPPDHPDRRVEQPGMIVEPATFEMHLGVLREFFELVHLDDWLASAGRGEPLPRRACAITFDDGWRDNFDYAWPILERHGVPATIFLVSDMIGTNRSFWPNRMARVAKRWDPGCLRDLDPGVIEQLEFLGFNLDRSGASLGQTDLDERIESSKRLPDSRLANLMAQWETAAGADDNVERDLLDWIEINTMSQSGLVRYGSHGATHTRIRPGLSRDTLLDEIVNSRNRISEMIEAPVNLFCYPNGDFTRDAIPLVRETYDGALSTASGWSGPEHDRHMLPRIGVHDDISSDRAGFLARLSGWI